MRALTLMLAALPLAAAVADAPRHIEGRLASGATYVFDVPANWNGSLLLFSHGYARGPDNPARNVARNEKDALLAEGYALAGSSYARTGWAIEDAVPDQLATLDAFAGAVGKPKRTYAWGSSMGGLVTVALVERAPERFDGALVMCASAGGTVGMMNAALDGPWVLRTLAAPDAALPVLLTSSGTQMRADLAAWQGLLDAQQATPAGRARIALAATLAQVPAWSADAVDDAARQHLLYQRFIPATMLPRDEQDRVAGGNSSWNAGVDYGAMLARSGQEGFVRNLYREAGLDLDADLARLAGAPRIKADPPAVDYMRRFYAPSGKVRSPVLLMQSAGDPVTLVEMTGDYAQRVRAASGDAMVREVYLGKNGHCGFEPNETLAAIRSLVRRRESGQWKVAVPGQLDWRPAPFLRHWPD
ncbi:alpha/beta hydrolase [Massilia terrae]|uniref:Tannase/feruloyl esterase family alpha/beta hydrolase n=1 Tax=Massilia terrae TaxID=1811224 RepID=A0ABT2D2Z4_9BURK|nr:tannase/feruloyl esterase family alpha/beta hydrolase [Massilia terrae]MCS0660613.1 tannase/feruloyl esterase family alpha/beta hydrolase [Massilia terrae]